MLQTVFMVTTVRLVSPPCIMWGVKKDRYAALPILAMVQEPENLEFLFIYGEFCTVLRLCAFHLPLNTNRQYYVLLLNPAIEFEFDSGIEEFPDLTQPIFHFSKSILNGEEQAGDRSGWSTKDVRSCFVILDPLPHGLLSPL